MNVAIFHYNLLGMDPNITPETYWLTQRHQALYTGFPGVRGYARAKSTEEDFLGTLVLALCQTNGKHPVVLVVPQNMLDWALAQVKEVAKYAFRCRRGNLDAVRLLRKAFQCLHMTSEPFKLLEAPERWAIFGYDHDTTLLPSWAAGKLLRPRSRWDRLMNDD